MRVSISQLQVIAGQAQVDWRTARKALAGQPLRPLTHARLGSGAVG